MTIRNPAAPGGVRFSPAALIVGCLALLTCGLRPAHCDDANESTTWHGYRQEKFQIDGHPAYVVIPRKPLAGRPWIWRARFPDYHAEMDVELLGRGFHIGYVDVAGLYGAPVAIERGDSFYREVVARYQLAPKPVLEGVSRGGLFVYNWALSNPDRVACIYCDTPVMDIKSWPGGKGRGLGAAASWKECLQTYGLTEQQAAAYDRNPTDRIKEIIQAGIPVLHIVSENDQVVPPDENTYRARDQISEKQLRLFRLIKVRHGTEKSHGHHFDHPQPATVVAFVLQHALFEGGYVQQGDRRTLAEIDEIYATMPPLAYAPPADRHRWLPHTSRKLKQKGTLRIVMLGDSMINDTSRSAWNLLLQRACSECTIVKITAVRGSTGCWFYQDDVRLQRYVLDQAPDLVIIGGISQRDDIAAIETVITKIRAHSSAEVLLLSGTFGRVDPLDAETWQSIQHPAAESYRAQLQQLAGRLQVEYFDIRLPWAQYIRESGKPVTTFKRDVVHANPQGEQIIGRILYRYLRPAGQSSRRN